MKRIILFFAVCLGLSVSQTTFADDAETVRAASKRVSTTTVSTSTQNSINSNRTVASKSKKTETQKEKNSRTAVKPVQQQNSERTPVQQQTVKTRATIQPVKADTTTPTSKNVKTTSRSSATRTVDARKASTNTTKKSRAATTKKAKHISRAAELNAEKIENIKSKDYSKCKTVYFECMDEFCANKDSNLRRCACSSRIHEFDSIKKQLSDAEDKMLDFNQRLLTVSLDKEDAAAINVASEGETAYDTKDKTESEKLLQKITETLNSSGDTRLNNDLSAISLSLDVDTAWDSIDSTGGISTSAKEGLELYNAAIPVCVEMAKEICSDEELDIAQGSYKLTIQQDCNTVAKSYDTLYNQAQEKIHESSALLDMSRLNVYQQKNSDDILTCKKKILDQLSDASVCGENLYKCLDTTGQYIDPSTGKAVLTTKLYNLTSLLKEPTGDEKWSKISQNEKFVNFLNSKKKFLDPATEQCQAVSDLVWKDFLDDALSQIKLAQNAKLEEVRQSCTTLVTECKTDALTDLSEFDTRALSTFSVAADKTVNSMCRDIENSCIALMNEADSSGLWESGVQGISTDVSYDKIIETCTQIGRDCIIQQCNGTSGNFALCKKSIDGKRIDILTRRACWQNVLNCVQQADNLDKMKTNKYGILKERTEYYLTTYGNQVNGLKKEEGYPSLCKDNTACLITEQIWGNCEYDPTTTYISETISYSKLPLKQHNKILIPATGNTLLSWFASNTGTTDTIDSCNATGCPKDYIKNTSGECEAMLSDCKTTSDYPNPRTCIILNDEIINVIDGTTNYCEGGVRDVYGNCCDKDSSTKDQTNGICVPTDYKSTLLQTITCDGTSSDPYLCPDDTNGKKRKISVYCVSNVKNHQIQYKSGSSSVNYYCHSSGVWLLVDQYGNYFTLKNDQSTIYPKMSFNPDGSKPACIYSYDNGWGWGSCTTNPGAVPTNNEFMISYGKRENNSGTQDIINQSTVSEGVDYTTGYLDNIPDGFSGPNWNTADILSNWNPD